MALKLLLVLVSAVVAQEPTNTNQPAAVGDGPQPPPQPPPPPQQPVAQPSQPGVNGTRQDPRQAPPSDYDFESEKQMLEYAKTKNLAMVMKLLPNIKYFDFDDGTSEGTLLHYAAFHGWTNLMDILLKQKNVSPTLENNYDKRTPLLSACRGGRLDSVKFCIKSLKKADWSTGNENGLTCSHFAAREGHPEILSYMIELSKLADIPLSAQSHKADKKLRWTPLHYAANNGHSECAIILLLEAGANPYKRGFRMQSAIDLARARGDKNLVDIMHDPMKFKITSLIEASLGTERKAREKAITALREDILKLKEALASAGPEGEHAAGMEPGGAPAMIPSQAAPPVNARLRRSADPPPLALPAAQPMAPPVATVARLRRSAEPAPVPVPQQAPLPLPIVNPAVIPAASHVKRDARNFHGFGSMNMHRGVEDAPSKRSVAAINNSPSVGNGTEITPGAGVGNNSSMTVLAVAPPGGSQAQQATGNLQLVNASAPVSN